MNPLRLLPSPVNSPLIVAGCVIAAICLARLVGASWRTIAIWLAAITAVWAVLLLGVVLVLRAMFANYV